MQSNSGNNVTFNDNNSACQAKDSDTGIACEETTSLEILNEFKKVYEKRIASIDPSDVNKSEHKIKIMTEWIKDLDAQNTMLVRTIEELEEAACCRVKMLEEKLKHTSFVLSENMSGYSKPSQQNLNELTDRINQLERDEKILQQRIQYLQSDIRGLLELIRRAQVENCWRLDGINFFEIRPSDIPLSSDCAYDQVNGWSNTDKKVRFIIEFGGPVANMCPSSVALCVCDTESNSPDSYDNKFYCLPFN